MEETKAGYIDDSVEKQSSEAKEKEKDESGSLRENIRKALRANGMNMADLAKEVLPELRKYYKPEMRDDSLRTYCQKWFSGKSDRRYMSVEPAMKAWLSSGCLPRSIKNKSSAKAKIMVRRKRQKEPPLDLLNRGGMERKKRLRDKEDEEEKVQKRKQHRPSWGGGGSDSDRGEEKWGTLSSPLCLNRVDECRGVHSTCSGAVSAPVSRSSLSSIPVSRTTPVARSREEEKWSSSNRAALGETACFSEISGAPRRKEGVEEPVISLSSVRKEKKVDGEMKEFLEKKVGVGGGQIEFYLEKFATAGEDGTGFTLSEILALRIYGMDNLGRLLQKWIFVASSDKKVTVQRMMDWLRMKRQLQLEEGAGL